MTRFNQSWSGFADRPVLLRLGIPLVLVLVTVLAHAWEMHGEFVYDDDLYIVNNPAVHAGLEDWTRFFRDPYAYSPARNTHYRPIVALSYAVNQEMGWGTTGFKLTQLALHVLTVLGLYGVVELVRRRFVPMPAVVPFAAAALFAVMPFNVEAVHYMTARSAVMCALFSVGALWLFLWMRIQTVPWKTGVLFAAHLGALGLALLSKETALTVPGALLAADVLLVRRAIGLPFASLRFWWPYAPYLLGLGVALVAMPNVVNTTSHLSQVFGSEWRLATAIYCLVENVRLMVLPTGLTIAHPIDESVRLADAVTLVSGTVVLALLAWAWLSRKRLPLLSFGLLWYFLLIVPSTFVHLNTILLENRGYSASAGIAMALAAAGGHLWQRAGRFRIAVVAASALVSVAFVTVTIQREQIWASNLTMWQDAVAHDPESYHAWLNLGTSYVTAGRVQEGEEIFLRLSRQTGRGNARKNLAWLYIEQGRYPEALEILQRLVADYPRNPSYIEQVVNVYVQLGRYPDAVAALDSLCRMVRRNEKTRFYVYPNHPARPATAVVQRALSQGDAASAEAAVDVLRKYYPDHPQTDILELRTRASLGQWKDAEAALERLSTRFPSDPRVRALGRELEAYRQRRQDVEQP